MILITLALAILSTKASTCNAFVTPIGKATTATATPATNIPMEMAMVLNSVSKDTESSQSTSYTNNESRRSVLASFLTTTIAAAGMTTVLFPLQALAEAETLERGGVQLTPFNSLAFNYRGGSSPGVDATALSEPSVSYSEFLEKLNSDQVAFVEFLAPNGDAAYATFKPASEGGKSEPIRIGEGYPLEDPEGWSSPAFVIKAVAKKGVPYKFVVPGLANYN